MISLFLIALFFALTQANKKNIVIELTDENFEDTLEWHPKLVIGFTSGRCEQCEDFNKVFPDTAEHFFEVIEDKQNYKQHNDYVFAKVDLFKNPELAERMHVCDLPSIKIFNEGALQGTVKVAKSSKLLSSVIIEKILTKLNSSIVRMDCDKFTNQWVDLHDNIVAYFGNSQDNLYQKEFQEISEQNNDKIKALKWAHLEDKACLPKQFSEKDLPMIIYFKREDGQAQDPVEYVQSTEFFIMSDLQTFLEMSIEETLMYYSEESQNYVFKMDYLGFYLWADTKKTTDQQKEMIREFIFYSQQFTGQQVKFVITDLSMDRGQAFSRANGVNKDNIPQLRLINSKNREIYAYDDDHTKLSVSSLEQFYNKFLRGELEKFDVDKHINQVLEEENEKKRQQAYEQREDL